LCDGIRLYSLYAPNGRKLNDPHWYFKLDFLRLVKATVDVDEPALVAGDFNVQPAPIDVYDPKAWKNRNHGSPPEREAIAALMEKGLRDVTREQLPQPGVYTWWNYRPGQFEKNKGMRIDLALCTEDLAERVTEVWIDRDERASASTSDHAPLVVDLELDLNLDRDRD
jgi:exodeoxyribonuclease III